MSTAVLERIAEQPITQKQDLVLISPALKIAEKTLDDPHPLVPVFIAGAMSLALSVLFVGSILAWLALRHSGVMAP
jgi:hypothetical protein